MDVTTEKTVVVRLTETEAAELMAEVTELSAAKYPLIAYLWQALDDLLS